MKKVSGSPGMGPGRETPLRPLVLKSKLLQASPGRLPECLNRIRRDSHGRV